MKEGAKNVPKVRRSWMKELLNMGKRENGERSIYKGERERERERGTEKVYRKKRRSQEGSFEGRERHSLQRRSFCSCLLSSSERDTERRGKWWCVE